jgi:hypothetical protein
MAKISFAEHIFTRAGYRPVAAPAATPSHRHTRLVKAPAHRASVDEQDRQPAHRSLAPARSSPTEWSLSCAPLRPRDDDVAVDAFRSTPVAR